MKTQLINLIRKGYSLEKKKEIIAFAEKYGDVAASKEFNSTPSTVRRLLDYKQELNSVTPEEYDKIKCKKTRIRSPEYLAKYKEKHNPKNRRKKNPFLVISRYTNSNYKLVCYRNRIEYNESSQITPTELWSLAKRQKCKCALSGIKLTSDTVSVDHIIPISKGGTNSIDNMRLVTNKINKMRNDMDDSEFFSLCRAVSLFN